MKKLFISQPMSDKTDEEILAERNRIIDECEKTYGEIEVLDSFFEDAPEGKPLWFLSYSLELLSDADIAYFADGWDKYRGCKIEHECAKQYGVEIVHDEPSEKAHYKYCSLLEANQDFDVEATDGKVFHIDCGEKIIVGFDKLLHHLNKPLVEGIDEAEIEVDGVSSRGLSEYLFRCLDNVFDLMTLLNRGKEVTEDTVVDTIVAALYNIGLDDDYFEYHTEEIPTETESEENE